MTPLPPAASGVADFSYRLLDGAARALRRPRVRRRAAGTSTPSSGRRARPTASRCSRCGTSVEHERARGGYDCVVYCLGNSEFHAGALAQLRRRSGVVLAHEVRLTDLYALSADEPGAVPGGFAACLEAMYDDLPPGTGAAGRLTPDEAERLGVLMAAEVVALADRFVVMSDVRRRPRAPRRRPRRRDRICVLPFGVPRRGRARDAGRGARADRRELRVVNEIKQNALLVAALPRSSIACPDASLAFVGPCADADREQLHALADVARRVGPRDRHRRGQRRRVRGLARPRRGRGAAPPHGQRRVSATVADCLARGRGARRHAASAPAATSPTTASSRVEPGGRRPASSRRSSPTCSPIPARRAALAAARPRRYAARAQLRRSLAAAPLRRRDRARDA